jgi:DHA1 family bicyclomycin/chloramphenicol resistance-like MFS transporter
MTRSSRNLFLKVLLLLMAPLAGVGIDVFVPSFPSIAKELSAVDSTVKFTIVLYLLGYAIGHPLFGTLSDAWGRKRPLIVGLILYVLTSVLIAFSQTIQMVLFLRVLQGIFVAAPGVLSKTILADILLGERLAKFSTSMTMVWALGPIIAPIIGGYLESYIGWQASFYFLAFYGAILLVLSLFSLKETNRQPISLDIKNLIRIYKKACSHKLFFGSIACISIVYSLIVIFNITGPFLIQNVLKYSPVDYGYFAFFAGLGFFIGSLINRLLLQHFSVSKILVWGILYGFIISILMVIAAIVFGVTLITLVLFTFLLLIGSGSVFPNCMAKCLSLFPQSAGTAAAIMGTCFIIGTSLISAGASFLETQTLIPLSLCYALLMGICLIIYFLTWKGKKTLLKSISLHF